VRFKRSMGRISEGVRYESAKRRTSRGGEAEDVVVDPVAEAAVIAGK
jgi:hypothetical protein